MHATDSILYGTQLEMNTLNVRTLIGVHCYMVQLWLGSAVKGACVVQGIVLLCCCVGRAVEGLYIQRGREAGDACTELVTSSWLIVDALRVVVS